MLTPFPAPTLYSQAPVNRLTYVEVYILMPSQPPDGHQHPPPTHTHTNSRPPSFLLALAPSLTNATESLKKKKLLHRTTHMLPITFFFQAGHLLPLVFTHPHFSSHACVYKTLGTHTPLSIHEHMVPPRCTPLNSFSVFPSQYIERTLCRLRAYNNQNHIFGDLTTGACVHTCAYFQSSFFVLIKLCIICFKVFFLLFWLLGPENCNKALRGEWKYSWRKNSTFDH